MSGTASTVECPECGQDFDPSRAGGWCTNPDCGEFRWKSDEEVDGSEQRRSDAGADPGSEAAVDGKDLDGASGDTTIDGVAAPGNDPTTGGAATEGAVTDGANTAKESAAGGTDAAKQNAQTDNAGDEDATIGETEQVRCHSCGELVPAHNFCKSCGADLSEEDDEEADEATDSLGACPECGSDVEPDWAVCPQCGEGLEQHRTSDGQDHEDAASDSVPADATVGSGDAVAAKSSDTAESDDLSSQLSGGADTPKQVVIVIGDKEITARNGDSLGAAVRTAYVESGGDSDQAQWISREHVAFELDDDQFYVVEKSTNGTKLNGEELADGERRPISDGDSIDFAGVTTGNVQIEYQ